MHESPMRHLLHTVIPLIRRSPLHGPNNQTLTKHVPYPRRCINSSERCQKQQCLFDFIRCLVSSQHFCKLIGWHCVLQLVQINVRTYASTWHICTEGMHAIQYMQFRCYATYPNSPSVSVSPSVVSSWSYSLLA